MLGRHTRPSGRIRDGAVTLMRHAAKQSNNCRRACCRLFWTRRGARIRAVTQLHEPRTMAAHRLLPARLSAFPALSAPSAPSALLALLLLCLNPAIRCPAGCLEASPPSCACSLLAARCPLPSHKPARFPPSPPALGSHRSHRPSPIALPRPTLPLASLALPRFQLIFLIASSHLCAVHCRFPSVASKPGRTQGVTPSGVRCAALLTHRPIRVSTWPNHSRGGTRTTPNRNECAQDA